MNKYLSILFILLFSNFAFAKWADSSNSAIKKDICNIQVKVHKDGSNERLIEEQYIILKDSARMSAAHYTLEYNSNYEKIEILEAKTIFQGKEYKVEKKFIEDKPLASSAYGFDQMNQILLAFPKAEIGSQIYIKYKYINNKAPLENFFNDVYFLGFQEWLTSANINVTSDIPLHILVNDPNNVLKVSKDKDDDFHKLNISLKKEIYQDIINEPKNSIANYKTFTWISISSMDKWEDLAREFAKRNFNKTYSQKLPSEFEEIVQKSQNIQDEVAQVNNVTSMLNDKVQYMMDNRTIEGKLMPRDLDQIAKSQLGDCKDLSAATVAILTKLGYKAQFALVYRGEGSYVPDFLPSIAAFNHVLVKVTSKTGKIYWVDPTNIQSMANGIFPDIANKPTLILDSNNPSYETIPDVDYKSAVNIYNIGYEIINNDVVTENGSIELLNESAYPITGAMLITSKENIENLVLEKISGTILDKSNNATIEIPDLYSRIVNDIKIKYSFMLNDRLFKTNDGKGFKLSYSNQLIDSYIHASEDMVSDIYLGNPNSFYRESVIKNINVKTPELLNFELDSKWLYLSRKLKVNGNSLTISDKIFVKKSIIYNDEIKSPEFIKLKEALKFNYKDVSIIFN